MLFPEAVLVQAVPDGLLLDAQNELCRVLFKLEMVRLADARDTPTATAHSREVDAIPCVVHSKLSDDEAAPVGKVQLLARASMPTSRSSMIGSLSLWSSNVFSLDPSSVCFVM